MSTVADEPTRWTVGGAAFGALMWIAAPSCAPIPFGSLEHYFLVLPLIATPIALLLLDAMLSSNSRVYRRALLISPVAATALVLSFTRAKGPLAGALALPWLIFTVSVAAFGLRAQRASACGRNRSCLSARVAHVFLALGAVWLLLSRLGVTPGPLTPLRVMLAVVHFHYSGFTLQVLLAATGASITSPRLGAIHGVAAIAAVAAIPCHVIGRVLHVQAPISLGVVLVVGAMFTLAITQVTITRDPMARGFLLASSASIVAAMTVAALYGLGEMLGLGWIGMDRMVSVHGLLNALGATTCGVTGHVLARRRTA